MSMSQPANNRLRRFMTVGLTACTFGLLAGCHTDMWIQPKTRPLQESDFFADGNASRPLVAGTVARRDPNDMRVGNAFYTGIEGKRLVDRLPAKVFEVKEGEKVEKVDLRQVLLRGRERFDIYCSPCHGRLGDGKGMIAQRGLSLRKSPGNYHTNRLRKAPIGHFYNVMTNGFGVMYSYASRIEPRDRWCIAAYIRVLQISQNAREADVPTDKVAELNGAAPAAHVPTGAEH
jgi:hypothetical protein